MDLHWLKDTHCKELSDTEEIHLGSSDLLNLECSKLKYSVINFSSV